MTNILHVMNPADTLNKLNEYFFPPYITLAHFFNAPRGWGFNPRTLTQCQLQYVLEGKAVYEIEGRTYITKRGDLVFHGPDELHSVYTIDDEPYICISLVFHFGGSSFPIRELIGSENYLGNFVNHPLEQKLSQIITYYHQPGLVNHTLCQGLLMQVLAELAIGKHPKNTKTQEKIRTKLALIRNYIDKHYSEEIHHKDLEQISGLSRNYIIAQFKKTYGMTPFDYLTSVRIKKARELVIQTNLSIGEIARMIGYADVHTFGRMFKSKTGTSLSQFCSSIVSD